MRAVFLLAARCEACGREHVPVPADGGQCGRCQALRMTLEAKRRYLQRRGDKLPRRREIRP
jgi:uncharacterized OB-fold protein